MKEVKYFSMFSGIGGFEYGIQNCYRKNIKRGQETNTKQNLRLSTNNKNLEERRVSEQSYSRRERENNTQIKGDFVNGLSNEMEQRRCGQEESKMETSLPLSISEPYIGQHPTCVGFSEVDKYATQIYKKHFNHKEYGDVTKINWEEVEDFDMLVGGFPCQAFSIAGKRGGFDDTRGTLFFEIARCLKQKQPRIFLLENVKGLLSHNKGQTFLTILATLDELGYDLQWQVLNSKNFGVPQNRERVFIVGHLRGTSRPEVFPIYGTTKQDKGIVRRQFDISGKGYNSQQDRLYNPEGVMTCLPNAHPDDKILLDTPKIRRLTPTECERLQGFPDCWTEGISNSQRYKCLGNAVTTNVITAIMEKILEVKE